GSTHDIAAARFVHLPCNYVNASRQGLVQCGRRPCATRIHRRRVLGGMSQGLSLGHVRSGQYGPRPCACSLHAAKFSTPAASRLVSRKPSGCSCSKRTVPSWYMTMQEVSDL